MERNLKKGGDERRAKALDMLLQGGRNQMKRSYKRTRRQKRKKESWRLDKQERIREVGDYIRRTLPGGQLPLWGWGWGDEWRPQE